MRTEENLNEHFDETKRFPFAFALADGYEQTLEPSGANAYGDRRVKLIGNKCTITRQVDCVVSLR